jgi:hypothetical protein
VNEQLRKLRRAERFALGRCIFWTCNLPLAAIFVGPVPVKYLVLVSIYANAESAYASYSAKRGERRTLEDGDTPPR